MSIREKNKSIMRQKTTLLAIALLICSSWTNIGMAQVVSPETNEPYSVDILNSNYEARVGEPFFLLLGLNPMTLPPGYTLSTLVDVLESPDGARPEILTGYPKTRLTMMNAGSYRIAIRISLMSKSSCGGVDAEEILNQVINIQAAEL